MAIKKSELYSSIWASCDELRGGMDASQYKDYVLVLLFAVTEADTNEYKRKSSEKRDSFKLNVEIRDLPEIFELEYHNEIWEELGDKCLSCGNCSMVCPTCYCYDVADSAQLGSKSGDRVRSWDSCLFNSHAQVAGGENFREHRSSRIKHRFYHKQRGFVAEYGRPSCIGCGRCIETCPVKIDIVEVLNRLRGEENVVRG
jgi:sulfhydrogenase subunit beta (sulfur reductase)